jgi:putative NIF3 family GTP cyclohydrolase 1 type 2
MFLEPELEEVVEEKLEFVSEGWRLNKVLDSILKAHPYEEVAYDVYKLENEGKSYGYGGLGKLDGGETLREFAKSVKEKLRCGEVRVYGDIEKRVEKVAFCGGSGASFIEKVAGKADVYVTGDIKYHDAQRASELGLSLIDAGHFGTEKHILASLVSYLRDKVESGVEVVAFEYDLSQYTRL